MVFPFSLSPWVLCTQSSSLNTLAAVTLECKLIKLCLYLVLGKAGFFSMLGLVCVALLYTILVTRAPRRDFLWLRCERHAMVYSGGAWERGFREHLCVPPVCKSFNGANALTARANFPGATDDFLFCLSQRKVRHSFPRWCCMGFRVSHLFRSMLVSSFPSSYGESHCPAFQVCCSHKVDSRFAG